MEEITNIRDEISEYKYNINEYLILDTDINDCVASFDRINICAYEVNLEGKHPFLKFLLTKNIFIDHFTFPSVQLYNDITSEKFYDYITVQLFSLLMLENFLFFKDNIQINGFYKYNQEIFLFIDMTNCKIILNDISYDSNVMFALIDEIINHKKICHMQIDSSVCDFFINNSHFYQLTNKNKEICDTPSVGYVWCEEKKLNFIYTFGVSKDNKNGILGPYYYFTNHTNALSQARKILNSNKTPLLKGGIVRFALFLGVTKYIENHPDDDIDLSDIKQNKLNDMNINQPYERLTMRISDYDGIWAEKFDSCYLGNIELDNGEKIHNTPLLALKNYNQQIPLSYHYTENKMLSTGYYEHSYNTHF